MAYDPQKVTAKQIRRAQSAAQDYVDGVNSVTVAPGMKAAAKKDKMRANTLAAIDNGKWENNTRAVSLQTWQSATSTKGGRNYSSGVADSADKTLAFHQQWSQYTSQVKAKLDAMPDTTPEQRDQKVLANLRELRAFKRKR